MLPEENQIIEELHLYAQQNGFSWKKIASMLQVSQNTVSNWKKGGRISLSKRKAIMELLSGKSFPAENDSDPLSLVMQELWSKLPESDRAKVYAYAAELMENRLHPGRRLFEEMVAAEPCAEYRPFDKSKLKQKHD